MEPTHVIVGRIRRPHGIRGEIVVEPLTDAPDAVFASGRRVLAGDHNGDLGDDPEALHISAWRPFGKNILVIVDEIADRTEAELWNGRYLLIPADEVEPPEEGEVFLHELAGMRVVSADGHEYGSVAHHYEMPHGIMLEVKQPSGALAMLPFRTEMVTDVDRAGRVITVNVPEGLFEG
jgi:16S rRNA processing protein RimM